MCYNVDAYHSTSTENKRAFLFECPTDRVFGSSYSSDKKPAVSVCTVGLCPLCSSAVVSRRTGTAGFLRCHALTQRENLLYCVCGTESGKV